MRILYIRSIDEVRQYFIDHRLNTLCHAISKTGLHQAQQLELSDFIQDSIGAHQLCEAANLIVIPGQALGECFSVIPRWKARDKMLLVDLFDLPGSALQYLSSEESSGHENRPAWIKSDTSPLDFFHWGLRIVDGVIVHSRQQLDMLRGHARVFYIPEYIDLDDLLRITPIEHEKTVIGLQVDRSCSQELRSSGVQEALARVCERRPETAVYLWDEMLHPVRPVSGLRYFSSHLNHQPAEMDAHPLAYTDVGVVLLCTQSNELEGWRRTLDFMALKIPWAGTNHPVLRELRPYGWLVQNKAVVWERVILDMVDHLNAYHEEAAKEPYLYAIGKGIEENIEKILSTYFSIQHKIEGGD